MGDLPYGSERVARQQQQPLLSPEYAQPQQQQPNQQSYQQPYGNAPSGNLPPPPFRGEAPVSLPQPSAPPLDSQQQQFAYNPQYATTGGFNYGQADRFGVKFGHLYGIQAEGGGGGGGADTISVSSAGGEGGGRVPYKDVLWALLFIFHLIAVGVVLVWGFTTEDKPACPVVNGTIQRNADCNEFKSLEDSQSLSLTKNDNWKGILSAAIACCVSGIFLSFGYLMLIRRNAKAVIWITIGLNLLVWVGWGVVLFALGSPVAGLVMLAMAALFAAVIFCWRRRIDFAAAMLTTISTTLEEYPAPIYIAWGSIPVQIAWYVLWIITLIAGERLLWLEGYVFPVCLLLSLYWVAQVIKNVVHVTASGTFASWYFYARSVGHGTTVSGMPPNPTISSFKRAATTSFGSICLGSLLVAILQTLRTLARMLKNDRSENIAVRLIACCCQIILSIVERLLQYFNLYCFTLVAIYGHSYWTAAKETMQLIRSHGIEAIINDDLVGSVLYMGALAGGLICAGIGALVAFLSLGENATSLIIAMAVLGFLIGFVMLIISMSVVESGVATIFVCFAMDPEALRRNNPYLYQKFVTSYDLY